MQTLQITKERAVKAYNEGTKSQKQILENLFDKKIFLRPAMDRIKSYQDACNELGVDPLDIEDFDFLPAEDRKQAFALTGRVRGCY